MEKKAKRLSNWFIVRPRLTGFIFFIGLLSFISLIVGQRYQLFEENKEREITTVLNGVKSNIDQALRNGATVALTLALSVDNNGKPNNFEKVAGELIKSNPSLQAVQLVPNGVVKYIYPLKGNEAVLNLNLFKSPAQVVLEVNKAIVTRKMYYQGPVKLKQGGIGVIGRLPLFINNKFWGFSAIVLKLDTLLKIAGIDNNRYKDYRFQMSKVNPATNKEEFFLSKKYGINDRRYKTIFFSEGDWKLYLINIDPYRTWPQIIGALLFGLGLTGLSSYLLTRLLKKQGQLQEVIQHQASRIIVTESKYKKIFDHAAIGIARINSNTGQILEVNQYLCDFLGYQESELLNKKIKSLIYPDDLEGDRILFKKLLEGKIKRFNKEIRYLNNNGNVIWSNVIITPLWNKDQEPSSHIVIIEDVNKRKAEQQILVDSQRSLKSLINTIDGIVWEGDFYTYKCVFISEKVKDILGYSAKQWMSTPDFWLDHLHPDDKENMLAFLKRLFLEDSQKDAEYRIFAKDGSIIWIRDIVTVIREEGQPLKLRGIMIDITNKKNAEEELNKSFNLVNEQNKRLLNFSYIVSHNLRSHAGNIEGISSLIENAQTEEERDEMIQLLKKVANNLNDTLFNLNNIVSIQTSVAIEVESLNLNEYVLTTLATQNAQILSKNATILNNIDDKIFVNHNRAYLESILLNLVSNALRYSHPERMPVISFTCFEERAQTVLRVSDNGIGIDLKKYGDKLFGIYQTFNGNADARGFGLFISKNQIEAMNGKIEVESIVNKGTTFKIYFG